MTKIGVRQREYAVERVRQIAYNLKQAHKQPREPARPSRPKVFSDLSFHEQVTLLKKWMKSRKLRLRPSKEIFEQVEPSLFATTIGYGRLLRALFDERLRERIKEHDEARKTPDISAEQKKYEADIAAWRERNRKIDEERCRVTDAIMLAGAEEALAALEKFQKFKV